MFLCRQKFVIGHAEADAGKQVVSPTIVLESARLANETVDDVPVVDAVFVLAVQTRQTLAAALGVPDFKMLGEDADRDLLADQPAGHAVGDRKSTRLNSSHIPLSRMPSSA